MERTSCQHGNLRLVPKVLTASLDHTPFDKIGIRSGTFSTGMHDDYHRSSDDSDKINYDGMQEIKQFLITFIQQLKMH